MRNIFVLLLALGASAAPSPAQAGSFDISPVKVMLSAKAPSSTVVITNRSSQAVRLQVSLYTWEQSESGEPVLKPTQDVLFFPAMLALNPKEARNIRIGTKLKPTGSEKAYRLYIQELPSPTRSAGADPSTVTMLTKLGVPVFVTPPSPKGQATLSSLAFERNKLVFRMGNAGNAHTRIKKLVLTAKNGAKVVHTQELDGWYLLAGGSRRYAVELPPDICAATSFVEVALESDNASARQSLTGRCVP
jgi:fimbrial chaperone protein